MYALNTTIILDYIFNIISKLCYNIILKYTSLLNYVLSTLLYVINNYIELLIIQNYNSFELLYTLSNKICLRIVYTRVWIVYT